VEEVTGELEERTLWEAMVALMMSFHNLGYKNIVVSDLDDLRTRDIPVVFKGTHFLSIKLVCSDIDQLHRQMEERPNHGLIDFELQQKMNRKNLARQPLVNEYEIDIAGKTPEAVLQEAIEIIDTTESLLEYDYERPPKEAFYSWVFSHGLR
jgi:hypothetical protein